MIVRLDDDLQLSATYLADSHLIKSIIDGVQAASNYLWINNPQNIAFDAKHFFQRDGIESTIIRVLAPHQLNTPDTLWVSKSVDNYMWLFHYLIELGTEYKCRFHSSVAHKNRLKAIQLHVTLKVIDQLPDLADSDDPSEFPSSIEVWRNEYIENAHRLEWSMREIPEWID